MEDTPINKNNPGNSCFWCGQNSTIIWVHGHGQCSVCGYNIDECCRGESSDNSIKAESKEEDTN